jgi:hypothetical protein
MGNDLAVRETPQVNVLTSAQLKYIAHTEFVPVGLRGKEPAILACVATGRALGIDDMTALRSIHIIDGKATFSAELMVQLVRRRGHSITGNFSADSCTVTGKRADNGDEMTVTWTKAMAQEAGLLGKNNWKKYGASMLWARAVSQLSRMLFADCFAGATYTPDEVSDAEYAEAAQDSAGGPQAEEAMNGSTLSTAESVSQGDDDPASPADAASAAQLKKLNVLVGTMREAGKIETADVYVMAGREPVVSEDGDLHWSPLRDSLSKQGARALIEALLAIESDEPGLSVAQLVSRVKTNGIDPELVREAIRELFPGASGAKSLSDSERLAVWDSLAAAVAGG